MCGKWPKVRRGSTGTTNYENGSWQSQRCILLPGQEQNLFKTRNYLPHQWEELESPTKEQWPSEQKSASEHTFLPASQQDSIDRN